MSFGDADKCSGGSGDELTDAVNKNGHQQQTEDQQRRLNPPHIVTKVKLVNGLVVCKGVASDRHSMQ